MPTIGILGGGQIAKMIAQAASVFNVDTVIFARHEDQPALKVTPQRVIGAWDNDDLLQGFVEMCDVVTLESEFVPVTVLRRIEASGKSIFPPSAIVEQQRDQLALKRRMQQARIDMPRFKKIMLGSDILEAAAEFGFPLLLKTRTGSESTVIQRAHDIEPALQQLGGHELLVEEMIHSVHNLAVTVARGNNGDMRTYPVVEIIRKQGIHHIVRCPAGIDESAAHLATEMAVQAVKAIEGVGVFAVEMYEIFGNQVLFNQIALQPNDCGLYTIEGTITSQFENHIRAILGWPLGDVAQIAPATVTINILGERQGEANPLALNEAFEVGGTHIHLYGKTVIRPNRKMGHITVLGYNADGAEKVARLALSKLNL